MGPAGVLKGCLWTQAASTLVLSSILADASAWIGFILTTIGFCFVMVGVGASHKKSLGFLYCYATLISIWTMLAMVHVLVLCGWVPVPDTLLDPIMLLGNKLVEDDMDPIKMVIFVFYGFCAFTWLLALICLVRLQVTAVDPTLGFEIQEPQRRHHTLEKSPRSSSHSHWRSEAWTRRFSTSRRQSLASVAPYSGKSTRPWPVDHRDNDVERLPAGQDHTFRQKVVETCLLFPTHSDTQESNAIFLPRHRRISQVVVTFMDENEGDGEQSSGVEGEPQRSLIPPAPQEESLSEMIFNSMGSTTLGQARSHPISFNKQTQSTTPHPEGQRGPELDREDSIHTLAITESEMPKEPLPKEILEHLGKLPQRRRPDPSALQLLLHSHSTPDSTPRDSQSCGPDSPTFSTPPAGHSYFDHPPTQLQSLTAKKAVQEEEMDRVQDHCPFDSLNQPVPLMQPNSPDPLHPISRDLPLPKFSLGSHSRTDQRPQSLDVRPTDNSFMSSNPSSLHDFLTNPFSRKSWRKRNSIPPLIPTIVLHPDEEDGGPPLILSPKEIEYLSTMPAVPLRLLVQPWDVVQEEYGDDEEEYESEQYSNEMDEHDGYEGYDVDQEYGGSFVDDDCLVLVE